jgi:hypothetical protein
VLFQRLPSTDELLQHARLRDLVEHEGHVAVAESIRSVLANLRREISDEHLGPETLDLALTGIPEAVERQLRQSLSCSLRPVINATGVILHTNLGRAPLAATALDHVRETAATYSNLEFDLATGERGKRDVHVDRLFKKLFEECEGAGAAELRSAGQPGAAVSACSTIVVNNNAAAVLLALNSLAEGGEVIVSRGELVEIGGSFRIPDVMSPFPTARDCCSAFTARTSPSPDLPSNRRWPNWLRSPGAARFRCSKISAAARCSICARWESATSPVFSTACVLAWTWSPIAATNCWEGRKPA